MTLKTYIDFETDIILYDGKTQIVRALEGNLSLEDLNGGIKPGDTKEQREPSTNYVSPLQIERWRGILGIGPCRVKLFSWDGKW